MNDCYNEFEPSKRTRPLHDPTVVCGSCGAVLKRRYVRQHRKFCKGGKMK